ncbi:MAG: late competence development ComFB family protein, partial [Oscillospiraceae bacterium]
VPEPVAAPAPVAIPERVPEPVSEQASPLVSIKTVKDDPNSDILYVNVMQTMVEDKAEKYIKLFGLCPCPRCSVDVKALALNNLPAKYVVMHRGEMIPMLTVYEGRYSASVTAQIIQACKQVLQSPRHDLT